MTTNTTEAPQVPSSLLTRIEAAEYLRISLDGLDRLIHRSDHPLPLLKAGRRFLFSPEAIIRWAQEEVQLAGIGNTSKRRRAGRRCA